MNSMRTQLIRLGSTHPELRPHIRAILVAGETIDTRTDPENSFKRVTMQKVLDAVLKVAKGWKRSDTNKDNGVEIKGPKGHKLILEYHPSMNFAFMITLYGPGGNPLGLETIESMEDAGKHTKSLIKFNDIED